MISIAKSIAKSGGVHIGANMNPAWAAYYNTYAQRVTDDSGAVQDEDVSKSILQMLTDNDLYDNTKLLLMPEAGIKTRTDSPNVYIPKAYDLATGDEISQDATQTTEANQPALGGNIAPNERLSFKNVNGESRYFEHPEISFAADEAWSISLMLNIFGGTSDIPLISTSTGSVIRILVNGGSIRFVNSSISGTSITFNSFAYIGKYLSLVFVANGSGNLSLYANGAFVTTASANTGFVPNKILDANSNLLIPYHRIQSGAMTTDQISAEYTTLRAMIPEIESVDIGTETIASSNFEAVASSNGTVISEATDNTDWATGAARWCYHNDDTQRGELYGKLYNKAARDVIIANPPSGWHVATESELTIMAALGGNALKFGGTDYWNTTGGTNSSGFTALGGSSRNADGTFNSIKDHAAFWCADSDKVLKVYHDSNTAEVVSVSSVNEGFSIRLIKD